jgi:Na+-translocating ferredoxin:NAD+ oxidoreductase subunit D
MRDTIPVAPPPHVRPATSVPRIMRRVLYALAPVAAAHVWYFGPGLLVNFAIACFFALASEALILRLRSRPLYPALTDGSAVVTAALLALAIPPMTPWWIPATGAIVAIGGAKHLYGGLGRNLFNPAMVGYVLLLISFPVQMTQWIPPRMGDLDYQHLDVWQTLNYSITERLPDDSNIDAWTRATPLDQLKDGLRDGRTISDVMASPLFGSLGGVGWEWINNLVLAGGLFLLLTGTIRWQIPAALLAGLLTPAAAMYLLDPTAYASPAFHLFSGATLLGAFFIATDPVSAATTARGRLVYAAGIGILTYAIRTWGGYPDGIAFAVLLMNAAVPLIDRFTRPRIYGHD